MIRFSQWLANRLQQPTYASALAEYTLGSDAPLTSSFLDAFGQRTWRRTAADRTAAAVLHIEVTSRISTQELGYSVGTEASALASLKSIFDRAREICETHSDATDFETVCWFVLNHHLRPFTSRWHRRSEEGRLAAIDDADDFRLELMLLRAVLRRFDDLLVEIRDGSIPPRVRAVESEVDAETRRPLPWGLATGGRGGSEARGSASPEQRDAREREAVEARRRRNGFDVPDRATGLALSGGGIRSATFALGILSAFARRGLLQQFDFLSTVSGGGYVGAFLVNYLEHRDTDAERIGSACSTAPDGIDRGPFLSVDRDSPTIGHIRQNSRYLASGPALERWTLALVQFYGIITNLVALSAIIGVVATLVQILDVVADAAIGSLASLGAPSPPAAALAICLGATLLGMLLSQFVAAIRRRGSDVLASILTAPLVLLTTLWGIEAAASFFGNLLDEGVQVVAAVVAAPFAMLLLGTILDRLRPRGSRLGRVLTRIAAPTLLAFAFLAIVAHLERAPHQLPLVLCLSIAASAWFHLLMDINHSGLHRHYRRKLAETFLVVSPRRRAVVEDVARLSQLARTGSSPYPILNAALNVPDSAAPTMRGRLTDFFSFTPDHCGSPVTGYFPTSEWEALDSDLDLATAMATSGAAVSPVMGLETRRQLTFWMALTNVRLGYWSRKPVVAPHADGDAPTFQRPRQRAPGLGYLLKELTGRMDERSAFLNLSDGGHIENLGVYELLRRRCKLIVAVDGEQDPAMTFHAVANLQRLAAIDLDVRIDLDLDQLRLDGRGLSRSHFQFCRIHYPGGHVGYLLYVKLSLTGNEGEFLRRFRFDEPEFPHHPTADQNFSESRFEAYRNLGEHIGDKLFLESIVRSSARAGRVDIDEWFGQIAKSMLDQLPPRPEEGA